MALRIVANRPDPAIVTLPWSTPLEQWPDDVVVPLPRGLSRHVVRIIRLRERTYAVKETQEDIAFREYRLLRDLAARGKSVLYYTSDLEEVPQVCDRVVVIFSGRVTDAFPAARVVSATGPARAARRPRPRSRRGCAS